MGPVRIRQVTYWCMLPSFSCRTQPSYSASLCRRDFVCISCFILADPVPKGFCLYQSAFGFRHRTESPRLVRLGYIRVYAPSPSNPHPYFLRRDPMPIRLWLSGKNRGPFPVKIRSHTGVCSLIFSGVPLFFPRRSFAE